MSTPETTEAPGSPHGPTQHPTADAGAATASPSTRRSAASAFLHRLASLNPVPSLFGPIFQKEVRSAGRRRATYALRSGYVLALLTVVCLAFAAARGGGSQTAVQRIQEMQLVAPVLTSVAMWFQFIAMILVAPLLAAPVICDERRARSLATLLTTPLRSRDIILGKLSSRIVQLAILTLLVAPILLALRIFGGVDATIVIAFTCISLTLGILGASLGVLFSIWHRRATSAALFALLTLALIQGGPSGLEAVRVYLISDVFGLSRNPAMVEQVFATASPYSLALINFSIATGAEVPWLSVRSEWLYSRIGGLMDPLGFGRPATVPLAPIWVVSSLYNLLVAAIILQISVVTLRRSMRHETGEALRAPKPRRRRRADPADAEPLTEAPARSTQDEHIRESGRQRTVSDSPILWRELRRNTVASTRLRIAIAVITLVGMALLYALVGIFDEGLQMTMAVLGSLIVMCQVVFMTTGSVAAEREGRTWEVLLTTPLTGREIIVGKFLGTLRAQWFLPAVILAHFMLSAASGALPWYFVLQFLLILTGPIFFFTATGQFFSIAIRKGITGAVLNLVLALSAWIGLWVLFALYAWLTDSDGDDLKPLWNAVYAINPLMMAGTAGAPVTDSMRSGQWAPASTRYHMFSGSNDFSEFNTWLAGAFAFYIAAGLGVLTLTIACFRNLSGRSS